MTTTDIAALKIETSWDGKPEATVMTRSHHKTFQCAHAERFARTYIARHGFTLVTIDEFRAALTAAFNASHEIAN
jgi:hypothetical protein